jgi:SAM-dependent methyltransferase
VTAGRGCGSMRRIRGGRRMSGSSSFNAVSGDGYEAQMGRWSRKLAGPFLDFAGLQDAGRILDAGCGTGALSAELLRRTSRAEITGIDFSKDYASYAAASLGSGRARFEVGDITALEYRDASFDQVYSLLVLHFVPDTHRALSELLRVAKPGGRIATAVWDPCGGLGSNRMFLDTAAMIDPSAEALRRRNFTRPLVRPGELEAAWAAAGLEDMQASEVFTRTDFAGVDDYWQPFDGEDGPIPAYLRTFTREVRDKIKSAVCRAYLAGEPDGPRSFVAVAFAVSGRNPGQT